VAGAVIGINPFDQPDVEASKIKTRDLTEAYEKRRRCRKSSRCSSDDDGLALYADRATPPTLGATTRWMAI
jgi:transaldolase/glucose-6-phosphate isomerase